MEFSSNIFNFPMKNKTWSSAKSQRKQDKAGNLRGDKKLEQSLMETMEEDFWRMILQKELCHTGNSGDKMYPIRK
jgi:hypothetical protein